VKRGVGGRIRECGEKGRRSDPRVWREGEEVGSEILERMGGGRIRECGERGRRSDPRVWREGEEVGSEILERG